MKNIFAYDVTEGPGAAPDGARYVDRRLDGGRAQAVEAALARMEAEERAARPPLPLRLLQSAAGWVALLSLLALDRGPLFPAFGAAGLLLWLALVLAARRRAAKNPRREAYRRASDALDQALESARTQLGVPPDAAQMDVITCAYRRKAGGRRSFSAPYFNFKGCVFWEDGCLCVSDFLRRFALPVDRMTGIETVDRRLCVAYWNQDVPFRKGPYKQYHITRNSLGMLFFKPHHILTLRDGGEDYQMYIAPYDLDAVVGALSGGGPCPVPVLPPASTPKRRPL